MSESIEIRPGRPEEFVPIVRLFEAALLEIDPSRIDESIGGTPVEELYVATIERSIGTSDRSDDRDNRSLDRDGRSDGNPDGRLAGAIWLDSDADPVRVEAIAVRPRRRRAGIGTRLCERAAREHGSLVANFDDRAHPFYASLGWSIERVGDRYRGTFEE